MIHAHHASVVLSCNFSRRVRGRIIHHDDFMRPTHDAGGRMDRLQCAAKIRLLVMRWNDE
jgi:hypothetical protein